MSIKVADVQDFSLGGSITGLPTPTQASQPATKAYADALANGLDWHTHVMAMATTNVNIATNGLAPIDGYTPNANDRILLTGQTTQSQNGIWLAQSGAWTRPLDFASGAVVNSSAAILVKAGTVHINQGWTISGNTAVTVDTTAHTWIEFQPGVVYSGGTGITVSGAGVIALATLNGKAAGTITGDGATTSFTLTHSLGTTDVVIQVKDSSGNWVITTIQATNNTTVTVTFGTAPANGVTYRIVVIG